MRPSTASEMLTYAARSDSGHATAGRDIDPGSLLEDPVVTRISRAASDVVQGEGRPAVGRPVSRNSSLGTRTSILAAALDEFADKGYDGARVDEIAMRAGVNKNNLYHHFGNKDDLFTAVLESMYAQIRTRQKDLQIRNLPPIDGMRKLVMFTGRIWMQFPQFQRLLHSENLHGARHIRRSRKIVDLYNPLLDTINEMLQRGVQARVFRRGIDPIDLYISITALTAHYFSNHYTFEVIFRQRLMTPSRLKQRLEHAADMVVRYLLVPSKPSRTR